MYSNTALKIKDVVYGIDNREYLLPAIQREFVWKPKQIELLFDSLMRDYPISTFLFWEVKQKDVNNFHFYEFLKHYHTKNSKHNPKARGLGNKDIIAVLDGQQRMTSLYLALKGTFAEKLPRKREDNPNAYPKRKLYLNLLKKSESIEREFDFRFLTLEEARRNDKEHSWFEVGIILGWESMNEVITYIIENELADNSKYPPATMLFASKTLSKLYNVINENPIIPFHLEKASDLDKVLQIFIRTNSGGTKLSYSDLLLSIASATWKGKEAKEVINEYVDLINTIGNGFNFNKDFVLKSCLVLSDFSDIAYKVDNFDKKNMLIIEENWDKITKAITFAIKLISDYGYNKDTLTATNSVIPIAYYIYKKKLEENFLTLRQYHNDRNNIKQWLNRVILKKVFGGQPDSLYPPLRDLINNSNNGFPLDSIINQYKGKNKSISFTLDDIKELTTNSYGSGFTFTALSLLYPSLDLKNIFHQDHIFPKSKITRNNLNKLNMSSEQIEFYLKNYNLIPNIQLLESSVNISKNDSYFEDWLNDNFTTPTSKQDYKSKHYIPTCNLDFTNFEEFFKERKKILINEFGKILQVNDEYKEDGNIE